MCCGQSGLCSGSEVEGRVLSGSSRSRVWAGVRPVVGAYSLPSCVLLPFVFPPSPVALAPAAESAAWPTWRQTCPETWRWVIHLPSPIHCIRTYRGKLLVQKKEIFQQNFQNLLVKSCTLCQIQFNIIIINWVFLFTSHVVHFSIAANDSALLCICDHKKWTLFKLKTLLFICS